jgi:tRNA(fMet)-specific endonuclease VapC
VTETIVDTDILSFYFKGDPQVTERFLSYLNEFDQINISILTYYEILSGLKFKKAEKQILEFEEFINNNTIIHISEESTRISSDIYG